MVTVLSAYREYLLASYGAAYPENTAATPTQMNALLKKLGFDTGRLKLDDVAEKLGYKSPLAIVKTKTDTAAAIKIIQREIDAGRLVIVGLCKEEEENDCVFDAHTVIAVNYNSSSVGIIDPAGKYDKLIQYLSDGYFILQPAFVFKINTKKQPPLL